MEFDLTEAGRNRLQERASFRTRMGFITKYPGRVPLGLFIVGAVLLFLLYWKGHICLEDSLSSGDFVIGLFTYFLGCTTIYLGLTEISEGRENRRQDRALAVQDRRRLRLKEQLEGLYSPLMSCIHLLEHLSAHRVDPILSLMQNLKGKYEFLAENDLKDLLREYYYIDFRVISKTDWDEFIYPMMDAIGIDCVDISDEYDNLTRKVT